MSPLKKAGQTVLFLLLAGVVIVGYNWLEKSPYCKPRYKIVQIDSNVVIIQKRFFGNSEKIIYYRK